MAAYASLTSLMHILDQLQHHPLPPISFNEQQVESLIQIVAFLQKFLEGYISPVAYGDEADTLEKRIANAAYAAEDAIGSYIVDNTKRKAPTPYRVESRYPEIESSVFRELIESGEEIVCGKLIFYGELSGSGEEIVYGEKTRSGEEIVCGEETSSVVPKTQRTEIWFFNCFRGPKKSKKEGKKVENESHRVDNIQGPPERYSDEDDDDIPSYRVNSGRYPEIRSRYGEKTRSEEEIVYGEKTRSGEEIVCGEETSSVVPKTQSTEIWFFNCFRGPNKSKKEGKKVENESHRVDNIQLAASTSHNEMGLIKKRTSATGFSQGDIIPRNLLGRGLQTVIEEMDAIKKEVSEETRRVQAQLRTFSTPAASVTLHSAAPNKMVGFDHVFLEILDKLKGGQDDRRQIIPIVGMGGIGKTTLARNIYAAPLIKEHFDVCAWTTVSQEYDVRKILREVLGGQNNHTVDSSVDELGDTLHKYLFGRRYLIIMDDMWSVEVWDKIKFFFPDNSNGSRIILTTRLSHLGSAVAGSRGMDMAFLDEDSSWSLFSETVFGENACPFELETIGKKIVRSCRGLPLSIVVIGGLLATSEHTQEYWEYIGKNLSSVVNFESGGHWLEILKVSYSQLPVYLKPCFLYMGVFEEDCRICVSRLVKLWIGEGFLKPTSGKSLEVVAREYLKDLTDRNLVLIDKLGSTGNIKYCKIHDVLRDLCLRQAEKERFYSVLRQHNSEAMTSQWRRIVIPASISEKEVLLNCGSVVHSLICENNRAHVQLPNSGLLKVLSAYDNRLGYNYLLKDIFRSVNLHYVAFRCDDMSIFQYSSSLIYSLWNLQTLIVQCGPTSPARVKIWKMPQIRHVEFQGGIDLPDPDPYDDDFVLENLQTLKEIRNFKCDGKMIERIPNIKKLAISYDYSARTRSSDYYFLSNLECLKKLESLSFLSPTLIEFVQKLTFPQSLKKLRLSVSECQWEDMILAKIGSLPHLEKLHLKDGYFKGGKWETTEGQFRSLKYLALEACKLECWTTESIHFPCLEHLHLNKLKELKEMPWVIGEIPTLESIDLEFCSESLVRSTKMMIEELEEQGEITLLVRVLVWFKEHAQPLLSLATPYFQITSFYR